MSGHIGVTILTSFVYPNVTEAKVRGSPTVSGEGVESTKTTPAKSLYSKSSYLSPSISQGSWSPWSVWSPCSRQCGGGITVQTRECRPAKGASKKKDQKSRVPALSKPQCFGVHKRIHVCNTQKCSYKVKDPRQVQCEEFNGKKFMDQSYIWEPFLGAPNDCALNCRAVGHMFYATLSPSVQDGVSCRLSNTSLPGVCIAGKCQCALGCGKTTRRDASPLQNYSGDASTS
ncbi:hypothetical protein WDU94_013183 [Cyamophila willieti]